MKVSKPWFTTLISFHFQTGQINSVFSFQEIYKKLCTLDNCGLSYIVEASNNPTKLYNAFAQLIPHPLQRPVQDEAYYTFGKLYDNWSNLSAWNIKFLIFIQVSSLSMPRNIFQCFIRILNSNITKKIEDIFSWSGAKLSKLWCDQFLWDTLNLWLLVIYVV